jgi:DNA-binding NarL/FixJ family response regulator
MTSIQPIRILISHTDPVAQAGLASALRTYSDFEVVSEEHLAVDVIATDLESGLERLAAARAQGPLPRILIVTTTDSECDIRRALKTGVRGYILMGCSLDEIAEAVRKASSGNVHLGAQIAQRLAESVYVDPLTAREEDVLRYVVDGLCNKEIARRLDLAVGTVKSHLRSVYAKLDVKSRTHAVAVAGRRGLIHGAASGLSRAPVRATMSVRSQQLAA